MSLKSLIGTTPDPEWVEAQIGQAEDLLKLNPDNPWLLVHLGNLLTISKNPDRDNDATTQKIIDSFLHAIECDAKYVDAYAELAHFYAANLFDSRAAIYWARRCLAVTADFNQRMITIIEEEYENLFQSTLWKSKPEKRCWMISDLLETIPFNDLPLSAVEYILGKPDLTITELCEHASGKALVYLMPADIGVVNERLIVRVSNSDRVCCFQRSRDS